MISQLLMWGFCLFCSQNGNGKVRFFDSCQHAVFSGKLSSMETEIDDKMPSNSRWIQLRSYDQRK
jgi:hypothetical protein